MGMIPKDRSLETNDEQELLQTTWEGEYFGTGIFLEMLEKYPQYTDESRACAQMEWRNVQWCKRVAQELDVHLTLEQAEKRMRQGAEFVRKAASFEEMATAMKKETPNTVKMYAKMAANASTEQLKKLGTDFCEHEQALCDWMVSEAEGKSDGAEKVFAWLERHAVTRKEALAVVEA